MLDMKQKSWRYILVVCLIIGCISYFSIPKNLPNNHHNRSFRAAIVTLTRGDIPRLINMLHSIEHFYPQAIHKYPVVIFYDSHGTKIQISTINYIKTCVNLTLIFENIVLFNLIQNPTHTINEINLRAKATPQRPIGYRYMCQFWSHTVFHHPTIKNNYDYIMRLDDDSYLLEPLEYDLFEYANENNLDYIYRALAWDIPLAGPDYLLPQYLRTYHNNCKSHCFPFQSYDSIYNNFFLTRIHFWHQRKIVGFLNSLLANDSILIYPLGDGNIHAVVLALASDTKHTQQLQFAYGHNIHIYGKRNKNFDLQHKYHNWFAILANNSEQICHQLIIIEPYQKQLVYIRMK